MGGQGNRSVVLLGMGMLGIWGLRLARERRMETVLCLDVDENRLAFARDAGASDALNVKGKSAEEVGAFVRSHTGDGADLCIGQSGSALVISIVACGGVGDRLLEIHA